MSQQPVEANVVLTADTDQYNSAMQQSASNTDHLGKSVDTLTGRIEHLAKSAGKKMFSFAAADVAVITAATAAYGAWERQMTSLSAQAAILNRNMDAQKATFNGYATSVNTLRDQFGSTTSSAAELIQTLSKVSDNTAPVDKLAATYTKLGAALQESPSNLAQSMTQLQRSMGTTQRGTDQLANQVATLTARTNTSGTSLVNFANQLAPVARMVGISQTDVLGLSAAFSKAGQDGYQAANVFSRMMTDVAYASQSGSPDLAKYANLVGLTVDQFKNLGGTDQFLRIFDSINRQGPAAITTLNRMGLDGMRTVRTVTALAQQSGGLQDALSQAQGADSGAVNRGSEAAFSTLTHQLAELRSQLTMTGESFGKNFAGPMKLLIDMVTGGAKAVRVLTDVFGPLVSVVAAVAAPMAVLAGTVLTFSKATAALAAVRGLSHGSIAYGFREGRAGGVGIGEMRMTPNGMIPAGNVGRVGQSIEERGGWPSRVGYNLGNRFGQRFTGGGEGPGFLSRVGGYGLYGAGALGGQAARLIGYQYSPLGFRAMNDPTLRERMFESPTFKGSFAGGWAHAKEATRPIADRMRSFWTESMPSKDTLKDPRALADHISGFMKSTDNAATSMEKAGKSAMGLGEGASRGLSGLLRGAGYMAGSMTSATAGAARWGAQGVGKLASSAFSGLFMSNPWMLGLTAAGIGLPLLQSIHSTPYSAPNNSGILNPYLQAGGLTPSTTFSPIRMAYQQTKSDAMNITSTDTLAANDSGYKLTNSQIKGKTQNEALTMVAAQFPLMRNNAKALTALSLDLVHQYGATSAQRMMNQLAGGTAFDPQSIIRATDSRGKHPGLFGIGGNAPDTNQISDHYANLFGAYQDQTNYVAQTKGVTAASQLQFRQTGQALQMMNRQFGGQINPSLTTTGTGGVQTSDMLQTQRGSFFKNLFKSVGIDVSDNTADQFRVPRSGTGAGSTRDWLRQVFSKNNPGGDALQNQVLSRFAQNQGLTGQDAVSHVMAAMMGNNIDNSGMTLNQRIQTLQGGSAFGGRAVNRALRNEGNVNDQLQAVNSLIGRLTTSGYSPADSLNVLGNIRATAGSAAMPQYQIAQAAQQQILRNQQYTMPTLSRTGQFGMQVQDFRALMNVKPGDQNAATQQQQAVDTFAQQVESQRQYFQGLLIQQREFNVSRNRAETDFGTQQSRMLEQYNLSRSRAEQDFSMQRQYAEQDFARTRSREEQDFRISRSRAEDDYALQQKRNYQDYTISRKRQEQDFNHSVGLMVKQQAQSYADIYHRIMVQRTTSGDYLAYNASQQVKTIQQQTSNLQTLRDRGLSNASIQQLKLTDPNNAQQLQRLVGDTASNPRLVKQLNSAISERLKAARKLVTDESSQDWQEFNRQYNLSRRRGAEDFQRQVSRSHTDFQRQMSRQEDDFQRSLDRQGQDFSIGEHRQETQFHLSMTRASQDFSITTAQMTHDYHLQMKRAADDLNRQSQTIDGNMTQMLNKAVKNLSGHAKQQAQTVLREFHGLEHSTTGVSNSLMQQLAAIFGVKFQAPESTKPSAQANRWRSEVKWLRDFSAAEGGVLPGYTPGQDVHTFTSPTGGVLRLSGGEAIMRPEWTQAVGGEAAVHAMNSAAKNLSFATGGIMPKVPGAKHWAQDQVGKPYIWGGVGPNGYDCSGFMSAITNYLRGLPVHHRIGSTANFPWPGFMPGPGLFTIGSTNNYGGSGVGHMAGTLDGLNVESRGGTGPITGDGARGYRDKGFNKVYHLGEGGFFGYGGGGGGMNLTDVLTPIYKGLERKTGTMTGAHILKYGDMSHIVNKFAVNAYHRMLKRYGDPNAVGSGIGGLLAILGDMGAGSGSPTGHTVGDALADGKRLAAGLGWTGEQWLDLVKLWNGESGWRWNAQNPNSPAYGIPQSLPGSKMGAAGADWRTNPDTQIRWGLSYIKSRYGSPRTAWNKWLGRNPHWYGEGAIFSKGPQTIGVGESGPEMVLPLDDRGAEFLTSLMRKILPGNDARSRNTAGYSAPATIHNMHSYQVDKSTTFSGPITVQANDPNQLITQLQARARLSALTNAARGGVKIAV